MKIAYLGQMADVARETSIAKKIRCQAAAWMAAGHDVTYFALSPEATVWPGFAPVPARVRARGGPLRRSLESQRLCAEIRAWGPDLIYFRYAYHAAGLPDLFGAIPTVAEINSDDQTEYRHTLAWWKRAYHQVTRRRVLDAVAGLVCVTHELAGRFASPGRPAVVIGNSIELGEHAVLPPAPAAPVRLVFMGSPGTPWHGLDRLGGIAALFPEWQIDVVGGTPADWHQVAAAGAAPPANLEFHGHLPRTGYLPLLARATAAVGTLGLYRKAMDEACPLKVREYLAAGLPVIGGCRDTDIPESADYYLRLPNDGAPLAPHRAALAAFVAHWTGRRVPRAAVAHLDTGVKEAARLAFLGEIHRSHAR